MTAFWGVVLVVLGAGIPVAIYKLTAPRKGGSPIDQLLFTIGAIIVGIYLIVIAFGMFNKYLALTTVGG